MPGACQGRPVQKLADYSTVTNLLAAQKKTRYHLISGLFTRGTD